MGDAKWWEPHPKATSGIYDPSLADLFPEPPEGYAPTMRKWTDSYTEYTVVEAKDGDIQLAYAMRPGEQDSELKRRRLVKSLWSAKQGLPLPVRVRQEATDAPAQTPQG